MQLCGYLDILISSQGGKQEIKKLKSLIELLKEGKIPEEIIPFILKGQVTSKDYEKALNILGEERLYDLKGNELYSSIIFADLFQKNDVSELSELSIQDKKQLLKNITMQGSENFSENDYLVNDFPLIPVDVKSYKKIIQALTSSINIKTEKISQEDENKLNKTLTSLSTTLAKLSDKELEIEDKKKQVEEMKADEVSPMDVFRANVYNATHGMTKQEKNKAISEKRI